MSRVCKDGISMELLAQRASLTWCGRLSRRHKNWTSAACGSNHDYMLAKKGVYLFCWFDTPKNAVVISHDLPLGPSDVAPHIRSTVPNLREGDFLTCIVRHTRAEIPDIGSQLDMTADGSCVVAIDPESFLDRVVDFPDGSSFERTRAITDYRRDPGEARILYACRRISGHTINGASGPEEEYIMKIKVQYFTLVHSTSSNYMQADTNRVPPRPASDDPEEPLPGPSETTAAELKALQTFRNSGIDGVPHLITSTCKPQAPHGHFSGGYVSYTIMTKIPGIDLMEVKFWSQTDEVKDEIRTAFIKALKKVWRLGFAPYDCALRNILWDEASKKCSIVDFEHYQPAKDPINMYEMEEKQRWGIERRPPPSHWAIEWGLIKEPGAK